MVQDDTLETGDVPEDISEAHCRHCGQPGELGATGDWLCLKCERYQDAMICPTCNQIARISLMPADVVPASHAPARRRK